MEAIIIAVIIAFVAGVAGGAFFTWLGGETRLRLQESKRRQEHEALPAYERAARAYERAAERQHGLRHGPEEVEHYYRQAVRIRQEAEEDMLAGRAPLTRPCDEEAEGRGGGRAVMGAVADYVGSRVARDRGHVELCRCPRCRGDDVPRRDTDVGHRLEVIRQRVGRGLRVERGLR